MCIRSQCTHTKKTKVLEELKGNAKKLQTDECAKLAEKPTPIYCC